MKRDREGRREKERKMGKKREFERVRVREGTGFSK